MSTVVITATFGVAIMIAEGATASAAAGPTPASSHQTLRLDATDGGTDRHVIPGGC
ncbi:hypothetical protein [Amycolatopsis sp. H20-H5]|uniref:hypothetical protein n=1 Tax=Amycolatopsis sp. H20-H5 TaxID=3046309 RepID=UPI002DBFFE67|nr:hypothetical protein [Amycolatopsis sp. H20-H5]MEC3978040.1 hypothetical protein [Amycolatopsis sp. H20-H5]